MLGLGVTFSSMLRSRRVRRLTAMIAPLLIVQLTTVSTAAACPYGDGPANDTSADAVIQAQHAGHTMAARETAGGSAASPTSRDSGVPTRHHHHGGAPHPSPTISPSLLRLSAVERLAGAGVLIALIWAAVFWAIR